MKRKALLSLLISGFIYTIMVIVNLLLQVSLAVVFQRGIITLIISILFCWFGLTLLENYSPDTDDNINNIDDNYEKNKDEKDNSQNNNSSSSEEVENETDNFSPINPPHLEVNEEQ